MVAPEALTQRMCDALVGSANPGGGWGYERGKSSRLEPTCWGLLAASQALAKYDPVPHRDLLHRSVRPGGYLVEDPRWPTNVPFNALVAFTWVNHRPLAAEEEIRALLGWVAAVKGVQVPPSTSYRQDNSLQGWSWLDANFSWVEPTAWGTLALQKGLDARLVPESAARPRIAEAERLLIDRCCRDGGWNFGNSNVMGQDLFPHVPTTALALLALQRRRDDAAVVRSLTFLESHWADEPSSLALGLSLICLHAYGRPVDAITARLKTVETNRLDDVQKGRTHQPQNLHALAVALTALTLQNNETAFRI